MFRLNNLFLKKMSSGLIFRLHLTFESILLPNGIIFFILFNIFKFFVKYDIVFKLVLIFRKEWMLYNIRKGHALLTINNKNSFKEILELINLVF
jgi:hypothetical protein